MSRLQMQFGHLQLEMTDLSRLTNHKAEFHIFQ